jgi:C-terminal peptidase prc
VLVGISRYTDRKIEAREHAEDDVTALRDLLVSKKHFAANPRDVKLLLGSGTGQDKATRANILRSLSWLAKEAGPEDLVLIAFFGQAAPLGLSGDRLCYFAVDSTVKERGTTAVTATEISDSLGPLRSKRFCTFLDINLKGFIAGPSEPAIGQTPYKEFLGDDGSEDHLPLPGRAMFMATDGTHACLDLKEHSVFAQALLDGLAGAADQKSHDGYEPDGLITVDELMRHVSREVARLSRLHGKTAREKTARPYTWAGQQSHYVLCPNAEAAPVALERLERFDKRVKARRVPARFAEEGRSLLERMPPLKQRQELRKAYQELVDGKITAARFETRREAILAGLVLKRAGALEFAEKVIEVTRVIRDDYVRSVNQGEMVRWAIRGLYRTLEEKVPDRIETRLKGVKEMREAALIILLADARQGLGHREDLAEDRDVVLSLRRIFRNLDPNTTYTDPKTLKKWRDDLTLSGGFTGIGVQMRKDAFTDYMLVVTPIKGSPAYRARLQAGDLIPTITRTVDASGKLLARPEVTSTVGLTVDELRNLLLGQAGTKVTLTVQRDGRKKPFQVELARARIESESVMGLRRKASDDWDYLIDPKNKIAYVRLTGFTGNTFGDLTRVMKDLLKHGLKGLVLDLRFNTGGLLNTSVDVADLFIDDGLIVRLRPRAGVGRTFTGRREGSLLDFPMVCLVNATSAAGSEIVAAALQDHKRALIVGERTYGLASVQDFKNLTGTLKGQLKLTTASFWRPSGKNLDKASTSGKDEDEWGVIPDKVVKLTASERVNLSESLTASEIIERPDRRDRPNRFHFKDRQLEAALEYLRGQIKR